MRQTCGASPTNQHLSNHFELIMFPIFQNKTFLSFSQATAFVDSDYILALLYPYIHYYTLQNRMRKGLEKYGLIMNSELK